MKTTFLNIKISAVAALSLMSFLAAAAPETSGALMLQDGYYTDGVHPRCTVRVATYREASTVVLSTDHSVDGYFCDQPAQTTVLKCDKPYLCSSSIGDTLYVVGRNRLVFANSIGEKMDLTFATPQIPKPSRFSMTRFAGWTFEDHQNCRTKKGSLLLCEQLDEKIILEDGSCKMAIQAAETRAMQFCQNQNFSRCEILKTKTRIVLNEKVSYYGREYKSGCEAQAQAQAKGSQ